MASDGSGLGNEELGDAISFYGDMFEACLS
jgi:hypothetical protein